MVHRCDCSGMSSYMLMQHRLDHHCCGGGLGFGSIWSYGQCNTGGGFWAGAGMGLGVGLMGLLNNWLGGWSMPSFSGWGMPPMPWNLTGGGNTPGTNGDSYDRYSSSLRGGAPAPAPAAETPKVEEKIIERRVEVQTDDGDAKAFYEFTARYNALAEQIKNDTPPKTEDIDKLYNDIYTKILAQGDSDKDGFDKKNYGDLLTRTLALKEGKILQTRESITTHVPGGQSAVVINGHVITDEASLKDISIDEIKDLDANAAKTILLQIGYLQNDNYSTRPMYNPDTKETTETLVCKLSQNPKVLQLIATAKIHTEVYKGAGGMNDNWIAGLITEIQVDSEGKLVSYKVDCKNTGEENFRYVYDIKKGENDNQYFIKPIGGTITQDLDKDGQYTDVTENGAELTFSEENIVAFSESRIIIKRNANN